MSWIPGGGGACAAIGNAAMAIASGMADCVVVFRAIAMGQFRRFVNSDQPDPTIVRIRQREQPLPPQKRAAG